MSEGSRKRAATSSLSSEFDKKSKLGLTDGELNDLNKHLRHWIRHPDYSLSHPQDVSTRVLAQTFREVVVYVVVTSGASTIDKSWKDVDYGEERINLLSREEQLQLASIWLEAREKGDWERFASHCVSSSFHRFPHE